MPKRRTAVRKKMEFPVWLSSQKKGNSVWLCKKSKWMARRFFFAIRDGKITFPDKPISEEQMKALLDFLYVRGIKNFELPPTLDQGIKDSFEKAQPPARKKPTRNLRKMIKIVLMNSNNKSQRRKMSLVEKNCLEIISNPGDQHWLENSDELKPKKLKTATRRKRALEKPWMKWKHGWRNQKGKQKNRSYFRHEKASRLRGLCNSLSDWTVFSVYPSHNPDNYKMDLAKNKPHAHNTFPNNNWCDILNSGFDLVISTRCAMKMSLFVSVFCCATSYSLMAQVKGRLFQCQSRTDGCFQTAGESFTVQSPQSCKFSHRVCAVCGRLALFGLSCLMVALFMPQNFIVRHKSGFVPEWRRFPARLALPVHHFLKRYCPHCVDSNRQQSWKRGKQPLRQSAANSEHCLLFGQCNLHTGVKINIYNTVIVKIFSFKILQ